MKRKKKKKKQVFVRERERERERDSGFCGYLQVFALLGFQI